VIERLFLGCKWQQVLAVLVLETHSLCIVHENFEIGLRDALDLADPHRIYRRSTHLGFSGGLDGFVADMTGSS
jgi:hypothetical protein